MLARLGSFLAAALLGVAFAQAAHAGQAAKAGAPAELAKGGKDKQLTETSAVAYLPLLAVAPHAGFPATAFWASLVKPAEEKDATEPEKPASRAEPFIKVLKDSNRLVRKRAILVLAKMGSEARDAIPALLEVASSSDEAQEIADLAADAVLTFSTAEIVETLVQALRDKEQDSTRRRFICRMLPGLHKGAKTRAEEKQAIYKALEATVADDDPQTRLTAATALEIIDGDVARAKGSKTRDLTQAVHALFDPAFLKQLKLSPEQVRDAVQAKYPRAQVRLSADKTVLEVAMSGDVEADWLAALAGVSVSPRAGETVTLRDVATLETQVRGKR